MQILKFSDEKVSGVPEFWLTILKNVDMLSEMIEVSETFMFLKIIVFSNVYFHLENIFLNKICSIYKEVCLTTSQFVSYICVKDITQYSNIE